MTINSTDHFAMYLRKSRADIELEALGEGETLTRHRKLLLDLASKYDVRPDQIAEYHEVVSGESIQARPEMQKLLNDVYLKKFKGVFVVEIERLARGNTKDQGEVADAFQYSDTLIITPAKIYDPKNEFDQEYFEFGLFMSRREYKTIRRRMEVGRTQSMQEGNYVGSIRPYGYDIKRINKKERILVINESEAPVVRQIFDWFTVDNKSTGWIARELTRMKIPTMTGKNEWNRGTVKEIIHNSHYIGNVRWNRRKSIKDYNPELGQVSKSKRRMTPDVYVEHKGKHEAIITKDQFDQAQLLFSDQVPVQFASEIVNPLAHLIYCKDCGKTMKYQAYASRKDNASSRYAHASSIVCHKKSISSTIVIDALIDTLKQMIDDFELEMSNENKVDYLQKYNSIIGVLESELLKQEKKRKKLFDSWESDEGLYTKEEFIERKQLYNQTIDDLKNQIKDMKQNAPIPIDYSKKIITLHNIIDMLKDDSISAKTKNDFLKTVIDRIEYDVVDLGKNKGGIPILDVYLK